MADATLDDLIVDGLAKAKLQLLTNFLGRHLAHQANDGSGISVDKRVALLANSGRKVVADGAKSPLDLILFCLVLQLSFQLGHDKLAQHTGGWLIDLWRLQTRQFLILVLGQHDYVILQRLIDIN